MATTAIADQLWEPGSEEIDLLTALYDAAAGAEHWGEFLRLLSAAAAQAAVILALRAAGCGDPGTVLYAGVDAEFQRSYRESQWARNSLLADASELAPGAVRFSRAGMPGEGTLQADFEARWLRSQQLCAPAITALIARDDDGVTSMLHLFSRCGGGRLGDDHAAAICRLMPHLQRAVLIANQLADLRRERDALQQALERCPAGIIIADGACRPIVMTGRGRTLLRACTDESAVCDAEGIARLLRAARKRRGAKNAGQVAMQVSPPHSAAPLEVLVETLADNSSSPTTRDPATMLFIHDAQGHEPLAAGALQQLWGLTPAEARLAALLALGQSLPEAAAQLAVSVHTVRRQLKDIFGKTGTRRQATLIRLLARCRGARILCDVPHLGHDGRGPP
ncbi:MAG: hypothetical protein HY699_02800 [Deltaproteobacteria bacterium]|nr:hypothetical protein [Deltaproteobacteria bacterium]